MTWNDALNKLCDVLAELYPAYESYFRVAVQAGLRPGSVPSTGKPIDAWHEILMEAQRQGLVQAIVAVACAEYPENNALISLSEPVRNIQQSTILGTPPEQSTKQRMTLYRVNNGGNMQADGRSRVEEALQYIGVSERMTWRVEEARSHLAHLSSLGAPHLPDFTLHNHTHSDNIILLLARLREEFKFALNGHEAYLLAASTYLHDLGMFFGEGRFRQEISPDLSGALVCCPHNHCDRIENYRLEGREVGEQIRETHNLLSAFMLKKDSTIRSIVGLDNVPYIMTICRGHRKTDLRGLRCSCYEYEEEDLGGYSIRLGLLAALLRLADALDFYRSRAPREVFENRALDFLNNPMALEHWLRHYFVTKPQIVRQDQNGGVALVCTVNFRVPVERINGKSYLNFFKPLFKKCVTEVNSKDLDIHQYPKVFAEALSITGMRAEPDPDKLDGFQDLPEGIIARIKESGCKDALAFLQWLQQDIGRLVPVSEPVEISETRDSGPFCLKATPRFEQFYNREPEVREALRLLSQSQNVEVTGARRIGKTWFLRHLSHHATLQQYDLNPRHYVFVYIDCQQGSMQQGESLVYQNMLECIVKAVHQVDVDLLPELYDEPVNGTVFARFLREMTRRKVRIILLLDEFEELIRNGNLNASFFSNLRALWSAPDIDMAYATASCNRLVDLFPEDMNLDSPLFDRFQSIQLGLLDEQDSRRLVEGSLRRVGASFSRGLLELVLKVGGGHPYFIQMTGDRASKLAVAGDELTEDQRQSLLEDIGATAIGHFKHCWKKLKPEEQYVLAALPLLGEDLGYQEPIKRLREQCFITWRNGRYDYFSPLFEDFVRCQKVENLLQVGPLLVDLGRKQVLLRGELLSLSSINRALLTCLMQRGGQVVSNEELWRAVRPQEPYDAGKRLSGSIKSLRKALGDDAGHIVNIRGVGYMFQ